MTTTASDNLDTMPVRIAFMGFRHEHILDLYRYAAEGGGRDYTVVAACEEHEPTRKALAGRYPIDYDNYLRMLDEVPCDALAVCDYFGKRGSIVIEALRRGKHVICDKPICTSLDEFRQIRALVDEKGLVLSVMLDVRDKGNYRRLHQLVRDGAIGEAHAIAVSGQHPLLPGIRPAWYFEPGKHGGTLNDIAIHAFDTIRWATGMDFAEITSARSWNGFAKDYPQFHDGAQFMAVMENGCGVLGDVGYVMPDGQGRTVDQYWRMTFYGTQGLVETSWNRNGVTLARRDRTEPEIFPPADTTPGGYMKSFIREVNGERSDLSPSSADSMRASFISLMAQHAADEGACRVKL
jgi:predicted dehydrogenase